MSGRDVWRALGAGLIFAAAVAIIALVTGDFGETHARIIGTSLGFSLFTGLAGAGDGVRRRTSGPAETVGGATIVLAALAYLSLLGAIWSDDADGLWRLFGILALLTLCGTHVSLVLGARRNGDTPTLDALVAISIGAATVDTLGAALGIAEAIEVEEGAGRAAGVVLVVMLLATGLQPILRRLGDIPKEEDVLSSGRPGRDPRLALDWLAAEVEAAADRIERLDTREAAALRDLAGRARR